MKKYFITGLVILLPLALTLALVIFVFNLLTQPFAGIVEAILDHYQVLQNGFLFLSAQQVQEYISQIIILVFLFFFTVLLGYITRWFFIHYLLRFGEQFFLRIPFISSIYNACKDVIKTIFTSQTSSFKQVVLVQFPNENNYCIGLVTGTHFPTLNQYLEKKMVSVFVPTTPNPTSGFLVLFEETDLIYLNMKVEDAFKYVISCGVIITPFQSISKETASQQSLSKGD